MGKLTNFDKNDSRIIDTAYCNGRYRDISIIRTRLLTAGAVLFGVVAFVSAQVFWF